MDNPELFPQQPNVDEHVAKHQQKDESLGPPNTRINNIATRLKLLEERYQTLQRKAQLNEQNIVDNQKEHFQELQLLNESLLEAKRTLREITDKISLLAEEVKHFATKNDVTTLQRYVEFWEPMDFVTRKEVNDFLRKKLGPKKRAKEKTNDVSNHQ